MKIYVKSSFNTRTIEALADRISRKMLKSSGAYIRTVAKNSIKQTKGKSSAPGQPPHTRHGRLKKSILFGVDPAGTSVVVGASADVISQTAHYHEYGGLEKKLYREPLYRIGIRGSAGPIRIDQTGHPVFVKLKTARMAERARRIDRKLYGNTMKLRKYPKRPFMGPALVISLPRLPKIWADAVK